MGYILIREDIYRNDDAIITDSSEDQIEVAEEEAFPTIHSVNYSKVA